MSDCQVAQG